MVNVIRICDKESSVKKYKILYILSLVFLILFIVDISFRTSFESWLIYTYGAQAVCGVTVSLECPLQGWIGRLAVVMTVFFLLASFVLFASGLSIGSNLAMKRQAPETDHSIKTEQKHPEN